jgi:hypothetical protein
MAKVNKRSLMVKNSVWAAKEYCSIEFLNHKSYKWIPSVHGGKLIVLDTPQYLTLIKDEEITISGKMTTYHPVLYDNGLFVHFKHKDIEYIAYYSEISQNFELSKGVEQRIYKIFNPNNEMYLLLYDRDYENNNYTVDLTWTDSFAKAKTNKMLNQSRQYMLGFTGYYQDMDFGGDYITEGIVSGVKATNMPNNLVIHEFDKITKEKLGEYPLQPYIDAMFRLRPLTVRYGSAVRAVYKEVEQSNFSFDTIMLFDDKLEDDITVATKVTDLKAQLKNMKLDKSTYKMKSTNNSVAIAFKTRNDATKFLLRYVGTLNNIVVDSATLTEVSITE